MSMVEKFKVVGRKLATRETVIVAAIGTGACAYFIHAGVNPFLAVGICVGGVGALTYDYIKNMDDPGAPARPIIHSAEVQESDRRIEQLRSELGIGGPK